MMRLESIMSFVILVILLQLSVTARADTTNRAQQFSPVPGIFVGGVGLLCAEGDSEVAEAKQLFLLLTRDRAQAGIAAFDTIDVEYQRFDIIPSLNSYNLTGHQQKIVIDRQGLTLQRIETVAQTNSQTFQCKIEAVDRLHGAAKRYLRNLLSKNKI